MNEFDDDYDGNFFIFIIGYITPDEVKLAFKRMQMNLTPDDLESMFRYFNLANMNKINVRDFCQNFSTKAMN